MNKKLVNAKQDAILWIDLEMTGLDTSEDKIIEAAAIITDWSFKELATYEAAVSVSPRLMNRRMKKGPSAEFWNSIPETRDALIHQSREHGQTSKQVERQLLKLVDEYFKKGIPVILAGNSIHMDRRFIEKEWPKLNTRLHYRMLDVSAWKLVFEHKYNKKFTKREAHRALDDIRGSIEELSYYSAKVRKFGLR